MRRTNLGATLALPFTLTVFSATAAAQVATVSSTGQASGFLARVDAGVVVYSVDEAAQGGTDLNGDGDALDIVLHVRDEVLGATLNYGVAVGFAITFEDGAIAFSVPEASQGGTDLNGDGDATDQVLHVLRYPGAAVQNLGYATGFSLLAGEGHVAFDVSEAEQNATDINGDGDLLDRVVHVYDVGAGTTTNLGLASSLPFRARIENGLLPFNVSESEEGATDLNGDGDTFDTVLYLHELVPGTTTNLGLATFDAVTVPGYVGFGVSEFSQGGSDLNGDGDAMDEVYHVYDVAAGTATNLGLAGTSFFIDAAGGELLFGVDEFAAGGADLNGDGDAGDSVFHTHEPSTGTTVNHGLALGFLTEELFVVDGRRALFSVDEFSQGNTDLNSDGDASDGVLHHYEVVNAAIVNHGLAGFDVSLRSHRMAIGVSELSQGGIDLNADGDAQDTVIHVVDLESGVRTNLGVAGSLFQAFTGASDALFGASEFQQGVDLNGDGDTNDSVLHAYDFFGGGLQNLGLAAGVSAFDEGLQVANVLEISEGVDLNGDGDLNDGVLHLVTPQYLFGLETDSDTLSVSTGGTQRFELDAGSQHAGELHYLLGTVSGTAPGIPTGAGFLPLNPDAYFNITLSNPNSPVHTNTRDFLDGWGESWAELNVPPGVSVPVGTVLHHAYAVIRIVPTVSVTRVSNPQPLRLVP